MLNESVIRSDDRENIFKTILLHHNYEHHHGLFNFKSHNQSTAKPEVNGTLSKALVRKSSGVIRKFHRSGSTVVLHPAQTGNLLCPSGIVSYEVSLNVLIN